mmetsp:Transcript_112783/g.318850  ORF Transcript_112783/g.318850 Transcript_112783/m.318850 type:complete len:253 (-) Transcript_112783:2205-2963(-)
MCGLRNSATSLAVFKKETQDLARFTFCSSSEATPYMFRLAFTSRICTTDLISCSANSVRSAAPAPLFADALRLVANAPSWAMTFSSSCSSEETSSMPSNNFTRSPTSSTDMSAMSTLLTAFITASLTLELGTFNNLKRVRSRSFLFISLDTSSHERSALPSSVKKPTKLTIASKTSCISGLRRLVYAGAMMESYFLEKFAERSARCFSAAVNNCKYPSELSSKSSISGVISCSFSIIRFTSLRRSSEFSREY